MRPPRARRVLASLLALSLTSAPLVVLAAPPAASAKPASKDAPKDAPKDGKDPKLEEARQHRDKGLKLFKENAFEAALVEFERAYELAPTWRLFYNLALIHKQLNDHVAALDYFERFLAEGGKDVPADRKREIDKEIAALRPKIGAVRVTIAGAPAGEKIEVAIDDVKVDPAKLAQPIRVNPGKRRLAALRGGAAIVTEIVSVAAGESVDVTLTIPPPAVTPPPPPPAPSPGEEKSKTPWIGLGITGGLVALGTVSGVLALSASSKLKDLRDGGPSTRADLDAQQRSVRTWSITTDVLFVGAAAAASISLYLLLRADPPKGPRVGVGPGSVVIVGEF